jgi:hypothetical protein
MANAWLIHVADHRKKHPNISYSEALKQASKTYTKAPKKKKTQKGGANPIGAIATGVGQTTMGVAKIVDRVGKNKEQNGAFVKRKNTRKINEIKRYQRWVDNGTIPFMTKEEIVARVDAEFV